jgi:hypothetical protein
VSENYALRAPRELAACPTLAGSLRSRVHRGNADARDFAEDIRELDPRQLWGRLALWAQRDPERLYAMVISLAALVDPDTGTLEWTRRIGGVSALHPDHQEPKAARTRVPVPRDDEAILRLHAAGARTGDIALRTGVHRATVAQVIARATANDEEGVAA